MHLSSINETEISPSSSNIVLFNPMNNQNLKNYGFSDYVPSPTNSTFSHINFESNFNNPQKPPTNFHPFINERDGLNRLLTVPSKYDPDSLAEPSNPSLYYKAERFNKERLVLQQADGNKHALGKLLRYNTRSHDGLNFMEMALQARKKKLPTPKAGGSPLFRRNDKWTELDALSEEEAGDELEIKSKASKVSKVDAKGLEKSPEKSPERSLEKSPEKSPEKSLEKSPEKKGRKLMVRTIETAGDYVAQEIIKTVNSPTCLVKYMKKDQKNYRRRAAGTSQVFERVEEKSGSKGMKARNQSMSIFQPKKYSKVFDTSDDFCNFYNKLDDDSRKMKMSTQEEFKRKTQGNFNGLNYVCKKFNEIVSQVSQPRLEKGLISPLLSPKTTLSTQQSDKVIKLRMKTDLPSVGLFAGKTQSSLDSVRSKPLKFIFRQDPYLNKFAKRNCQNW